jgi:hypothetical protein
MNHSNGNEQTEQLTFANLKLSILILFPTCTLLRREGL